MKSMVSYSHQILKEYVGETAYCIDFTMGNGNDTIFLAELAKKGFVESFDIQQQAYDTTQKKLSEKQIKNVRLHLHSHADFDQIIKKTFDAGIFNFGYLPHKETGITTLCDTSAIAINKALQWLNPKGILVLVVYPGHTEGMKEYQYIQSYMKTLDARAFHVLTLQKVNRVLSPCIYAIEKRV